MIDGSSPQTSTKPSQRLVSLDVVRGLTVAFMVLVNNNGSEQHAYWPLKHSDWNGWTPTDFSVSHISISGWHLHRLFDRVADCSR